jgi:hypothetical protein
MRISPMPRVCFGLLCGLLVTVAGCGNPSSQTLASLTVTASPSSIPVGGAAVLKAVAHLSDGTTQDVTTGTQWSVSNGTLATIGNGALIAKAQGSLTVQAAYVEAAPAGSSPASATASPQNLSASTQVTITAAGGSGAINIPTITWNPPAAIAYGTALSTTQLSATANVPGTFSYTPAAGTTLKAGKQTLSATFIPTNLKTYSAATASVQLTVNQAAPTITWATPAPISPGTALTATQLDATASVPGSLMYNPAVGAVLPAGIQQLTAVFSPTDTTDYSSVTAHTSLVVSSTTSGPTGNPVPLPPAPPAAPSPEDPAGGCRLAAGASTSAIQTAVNSAASGSCAAPSPSTVLFAAGNYTISSQISIPCPKTAMVIQGTTPSGVGTTWPITPTTILTSTLTNNWAFSGTACNVGTTFQYLQFNGGNPSGGGGGFLNVPPGMNHLTVQWNWLYGVSAIQAAGQSADSIIWMDGVDTSGATRTQNTTIRFNRLGTSGSNDCLNLMNVIGGNNACDSSGYNLGGTNTCLYQDGAGEKEAGGYCAAVGIHVKTDNLTISNNAIAHLEQGLKFFEGCGTVTCPDQFDPTNLVVSGNDFNQIHRIVLEAQQTPAPNNFSVTNNSMHDEVLFGGVSWGLSLPQEFSKSTGNLLIENTPKGKDKYGNSASRSYGIEFWGNESTANNNLVQGLWGGGLAWGYGGSGWTVSENTFQQLTT